MKVAGSDPATMDRRRHRYSCTTMRSAIDTNPIPVRVEATDRLTFRGRVASVGFARGKKGIVTT
jgi:hypothetical protein